MKESPKHSHPPRRQAIKPIRRCCFVMAGSQGSSCTALFHTFGIQELNEASFDIVAEEEEEASGANNSSVS